LDKGATYGITKNVGLSLITFAHIFDNGNIVFFDGTKGYLSTDNLSSFAETTIKNISGGTYSPYASDNYKVWSYDYETINGVEVLVFGNYTNVNPRANAWYSVDNGVTIKSFNEAVGGHYHGINYDRISGKWMANVGDGNLVREFIYNTVTDQWTLNRSLTVPASVGFSRFGDYYYWFSDTVGNTVPYGFYRVRVEDVADAATKLETMQLYETSTGVWVDDTEKLMYGYNKLLDGIIYSTDGVNFFVMAGGGAGIATTHPDNNHEYLGQIIKDGPNYVLYTVGPVYMLKIGRCLY
jgi:hypothetical protein